MAARRCCCSRSASTSWATSSAAAPHGWASRCAASSICSTSHGDPRDARDTDLHLFNEGSHLRLWEKLGAHPGTADGRSGTHFAVWAPNAERVSVIGDWNGWRRDVAPLARRGDRGSGRASCPASGEARATSTTWRRATTATASTRPTRSRSSPRRRRETASIVWTLDYAWDDAEWMAHRAARQALNAPMTIYEMHLGSWRRVPEDGEPLAHLPRAGRVAARLRRRARVHARRAPAGDGAPVLRLVGLPDDRATSRRPAGYGTPQDLMYLIDRLHQRGIGVILDWVPAHFPSDEHGLGYFDGTHLYEHGDPRQGFHPDWNSFIFNYGRHEVRSFLLSSALFWLERVPRRRPARGRRRLDALPRLLAARGRVDPEPVRRTREPRRHRVPAPLQRGSLRAATRACRPSPRNRRRGRWCRDPTYVGGLGFGFKWDMGWMHDTLGYVQQDPVYRKFHHDDLTFRGLYAFTENFVLPLSHDEVVHGKGSLLGKMPGDDWQQRANLRLLLGYQCAQPGKKLLFMGGRDRAVARVEPRHQPRLASPRPIPRTPGSSAGSATSTPSTGRAGAARARLRRPRLRVDRLPRRRPEHAGLPASRQPRRRGVHRRLQLHTRPAPQPSPRRPWDGEWREILNSDATLYGGSGQGNLGGAGTTPVASHGHAQSIVVTVPPLAIVVFKGRR